MSERLDAMGIGHLVDVEAISDSETPDQSASIDTPNGKVLLPDTALVPFFEGVRARTAFLELYN